MLRAFQRQLIDVLVQGLATWPLRTVLLDVTPGAGKSMTSLIVAQHYIPARLDRLCIVTPRETLARQAESSFVDPALLRELGLSQPRHRIRHSYDNKEDPCRGQAGYSTTYQAVAADAGLHLKELGRARYGLILDEPHHCGRGSPWSEAVQPLVERAALVVLMSGTWSRHDKKPISWLPYQPDGLGNLLIDWTQPEDRSRAVIRYTRTQALREQAVINLSFHQLDGAVEWLDEIGQRQVLESLAQTPQDQTSSAIFTALRTEFADQLLSNCLNSWRQWRRHHPRSKMLVVAASQRVARTYLSQLQQAGEQRVGLATSDESREAVETMRRFRLPLSNAQALEILVTVGMAYEGFDVKEISHLACLTHIRSVPWLEQTFARAARYDPDGGPWAEQVGFVYVPDDPVVNACIKQIRDEQDIVARERENLCWTTPYGEGRGGPRAQDDPIIIPISGDVRRERVADLATEEALSYDETERLKAATQRAGTEGVIDLLKLRRTMDAYDDISASGPPPQPPPTDLPPSEREQLYRTSIQSYVNRYERAHALAYGTINRELRFHFAKSRTTMGVSELEAVWAWLVKTYPIASAQADQAEHDQAAFEA